MKKIVYLSLLVTPLLMLASCTGAVLLNNGIFTHTVEPITFNRDVTKIREAERVALGRIQQFTTPMNSALSIRVGKNGLGDVAKEHGINTIYYADIEKWSIALGLWRMDVVHIYGN